MDRSTGLWVWPNQAEQYLLKSEQLAALGRAGFLSDLVKRPPAAHLCVNSWLFCGVSSACIQFVGLQFIGAGHQILPQSLLKNSTTGWPFALPSDSVTGMWAQAALDAIVVQANRYSIGISPTVSGPLNVSDARSFLLNESAVRRFTDMMLKDALDHHYSGYVSVTPRLFMIPCATSSECHGFSVLPL